MHRVRTCAVVWRRSGACSRAGVSSALALLAVLAGCLGGRAGPPRTHGGSALEAAGAAVTRSERGRASERERNNIEARLDGLVAALDGASFAGARCRARAVAPGATSGGVLASPGHCTPEQARQETRSAFHAVLLALARDLSGLSARLRSLEREDPVFERGWHQYQSTLEPTAVHLDWMVAALEIAHTLVESASGMRPGTILWQRAGERYEAALLGAQVLSLWMSWFDVAKVLHRDTTLDVEWILVHLWRTWGQMEPWLLLLRDGTPRQVAGVAPTLDSWLREWSEGLYRWGVDAERRAREAVELVQKLLLVQAAFDIVATRQLIGPALVARARPLVFVLPGIGGVTAGGAAVGVRVVISAEWVAAMQHLVAIGAVAAVDIARIAGVSSAMSTPKLVPGTAAGATGQVHHAISRAIHKQLQEHRILAGKYRYRDPRLVTRGADKSAHRGYQQWHRDLDDEIVVWLRETPDATPEQFEAYLRWRYSLPDLAARFPGGL